MSGGGEVEKSLAKWLTKAKTIPAPPGPTERRGSAQPHAEVVRPSEPLRQLNLKISANTYRRIKGLAYRDRLSLVAMLDEMIALYEQTRGKLEEQ